MHHFYRRATICAGLLFCLLILSGCQLQLVNAKPFDDAIAKIQTLNDSDTGTTAIVPTATVPYEPFTIHAPSSNNLTAAQIFSTISPSVAFIETPYGTGSGVLIEHGFLLTNAHVVWPYEDVRVVFPDGSEFEEAPVYAWDLMADLALIGPVETDIAPVALVDGTGLDIGSDVYLIGYPAEPESFPQPSITNGILSRVRTWEPVDYSLYQVDATTVGGQSGGILVTYQGDIIGISTFYYNGFGLAGSVADALPRLNGMLAHDTLITQPERALYSGEAAEVHQDILAGDQDAHTYILRVPTDRDVDVFVHGIGNPAFTVTPVFGSLFDAQLGTVSAVDWETIEAEANVPYVIEVMQPGTGSYRLSSTEELIRFDDPDSGLVELGATTIGGFDYASDVDIFEIELAAGEVIEISIDSLEADPLVSILYSSPNFEETAVDDDSGGGVFGQSAQLIYEAPKDGIYSILVLNLAIDIIGNYLLEARTAPDDAVAVEPVLSRVLLNTEYGRMDRYVSEESDFSTLVPADWVQGADEACGGVNACYSSEFGFMEIFEESIFMLPRQDQNLAGYTEALESALSFNLQGYERTAIEEFRTPQGLEARVLDYSIHDGRYHSRHFIYVDVRNGTAINITFYGESGDFREIGPLAEYVFQSFRAGNERALRSSPIHHVDRAKLLAAEEKYDEAMAAIEKAIELDEGFADAYSYRAALHGREGAYDAALADLEQATSLEPEDAELYVQYGHLLWTTGNYEDALEKINLAIEYDPDDYNTYNFHALILTSMERYDEALTAIKASARASSNFLLPDVRDTRGYIYIKMGRWLRAKADFDELFEQGLRFPYALLGGGIAYAELGYTEEARELLEEGLPQVADVEHPDPQLSDLISMAEQTLAELSASE